MKRFLTVLSILMALVTLSPAQNTYTSAPVTNGRGTTPGNTPTAIETWLNNLAANQFVGLIGTGAPTNVACTAGKTQYFNQTNSHIYNCTVTGNPGTFVDTSVGSAGPTGPGYAATSSTSLTVGTGSKSFTTQSGLAYSAGARVRAASAATPANYMEGIVASYSGTTLVLTVDSIGGSGTAADWNLNIAGDPGSGGVPITGSDAGGIEAHLEGSYTGWNVNGSGHAYATGVFVCGFNSTTHLRECSPNGSSTFYPEVLGPTSSTSGNLASFSSADGGRVQDSGIAQALLTRLRRRVCDLGVGDTSASAALSNGQLGPQKRVCFIPDAATVLEINVAADAGTPNVIVGRNVAGTQANLLSSALATAASGGIACSNTGGTTGLDSATTFSATLQNTALAAGSYIELVSGTAGGVAKWMTIHVVYQVN